MQRIKLRATNLKSLLPEKLNRVETIKRNIRKKTNSNTNNRNYSFRTNNIKRTK